MATPVQRRGVSAAAAADAAGGNQDVQGDMLAPSVANTPWVSQSSTFAGGGMHAHGAQERMQLRPCVLWRQCLRKLGSPGHCCSSAKRACWQRMLLETVPCLACRHGAFSDCSIHSPSQCFTVSAATCVCVLLRLAPSALQLPLLAWPSPQQLCRPRVPTSFTSSPTPSGW